MLQKNQSLQSEVARFRAEAEEERVRLKGANDKVELLTAEVEELQCQVTGYSRAVEAAKEQVMELEARLEAVKVEEVGNSSREDKGNSLFSEVEDRRCLLERQMVTMQKKYDSIKVGNGVLPFCPIVLMLNSVPRRCTTPRSSS